MTIINEISTIPSWQGVVALLLVALAFAGLMISGVMIYREGGSVGSILVMILSVITIILGVVWNISQGDYEISNSMSKDVARYEITIDDNKVSSDALVKLQNNYEIIESEKIGCITKAIVEGPRYETIFSESEIAKMSP